ncbi:RNA chaperone ProQ [Candidatus Steffania adelgidicola]|uniref:RNA chaperone ProQ n=1 Tax=Candidatus Steffania adelgidicola TaxID=1076626 RepID=UPI001D01F5DC|nr:RNA chaperone ProQ [Candidatus Steffania adelgidicola]UDG79605.1 RNA chaperone ProQ [Candidatus Steffania adelgidicola]
MENQPKFNGNKEIIVFLAKRFPLCFAATGEKRPLKIGIFHDILKRMEDEKNISKTKLRSALRLYTSTWRYLYGITCGIQRVDLDGNLCGAIETQHIEHARRKLEETKTRIQLQRVAQQSKKSENYAATASSRPSVIKRFSKSDSVIPCKPLVKKEHPQVAHKKLLLTRIPVTNVSMLQIGQAIKVKVGNNPIDATVINIAKEGIRVQIPSGIDFIIRPEHLEF